MKPYDLHRCARANLAHELRKAIMKGADVNAKDNFGATPLHYAIAEKQMPMISLLLALGADVTVQDGDGKTALHYAVEYKMPIVAEDLLKKDPAVIAIADRFGNQPLWTAAFNAKGNYELVALLLRYGANPNHRNNTGLTPLDIPKRKHDDALLHVLQSK